MLILVGENYGHETRPSAVQHRSSHPLHGTSVVGNHGLVHGRYLQGVRSTLERKSLLLAFSIITALPAILTLDDKTVQGTGCLGASYSSMVTINAYIRAACDIPKWYKSRTYTQPASIFCYKRSDTVRLHTGSQSACCKSISSISNNRIKCSKARQLTHEYLVVWKQTITWYPPGSHYCVWCRRNVLIRWRERHRR